MPHPSANRPAVVVVTRLIAVMIVAFAVAMPVVSAVPTAQAADPGAMSRSEVNAEMEAPSSDALPALVAAAQEQAAAAIGDPDRYAIDASFDPSRGLVTGTALITFVNRTGERLDDLYLSLDPNAAPYGGGAMVIDALRVDGRTVAHPARGLSDDETTLLVPMSRPLPPGGSVEIEVGFPTTLSADGGAANYLELPEPPGTWFLESWYPTIARFEPSRGWLLAPPVVQTGRAPWDVALYDVTVTMPRAFRSVTTGDLVEERLTGTDARRRYVAGPTEGFLVIADDDFTHVTTRIGDSTVRVHSDPSETETARKALEYAAHALDNYSARFGLFPLRELDIVQTPLRMGSGQSSEGLIVVGSPLPDEYDEEDWEYEPMEFETDPDQVDLVAFESLLAHEVAHQWWGNSVRSDYSAHAFIVEGLTEYVAFTQLEASQGEKIARRVMIDDTVQGYLEQLEYGGDQIADRTGRRGYSSYDNYSIVYGKSALGFLAINTEIGDAAFDEGLATYAADHTFGVATPDDLRAAFETASGKDLDELWRFWFESAETTPSDVRALLRAAS